MGDILKEAIADAKAVRETALQNAKMALEEAFTPQLKNMLSAKLKEDELEEGDPVVEDDMEDEDEVDEFGHDDEEAGEEVPDEGYHEDEEVPEEEPEVEEEGIIEIDGVKYAPVVSEDEEEEFGDDEEEVEEDLDLESVIKELESELSEDEDLEENTDETVEENTDETVEESKDEIEEEFEIDESLFEEEVEESNTSELESELKEYKEAVVFLKDKLHEVNILNAKLLFTNKLFKEYSLDNGQKLKVVETFDRAQTTREIKLVYSTLAESFKSGPITRKTKNITESASSAVGSTKPSTESKKVITEETQVADRFRKLAGLIK